MEIEDIEINLLIQAIYMRYGYDYRNYTKPSIKRRITDFLIKSDYENISSLISVTLRDEAFLKELINAFSVTVTEMFRDPDVYKDIRKRIIPKLKSFPKINIWHAGCATGEEVYSLAIMLKEEGIYDKCQIYATDINDRSLKIANDGIYSTESIKKATKNYIKSGGKESFTNYYYSKYDNVIIDKSLRKNITFTKHNLVTDEKFNEMNFIICRNVLIYFNKDLQNKVLKLFLSSLKYNGYLCLGTKESIAYSDVETFFEPIEKENKLFIKKLFDMKIK